MYQQGRRFNHTKHQKAWSIWKKNYVKEKDAQRQDLLLRNAEKFKAFVDVKDDPYSYDIKHNLENIEDKELKNLESKYDEQLREYFFEHFQYFYSLSLKEQFDILADRFEWILHEPTMFLIDRILYQDPSRNPYLMGNYAPV